MSTNDVPGAVASNNDQLAALCWAEHTDGSLIFVESTEGSRVIYCIFDTAHNTQYRDAMPESSFKSTFSWKPSDPKSVKWTWHDKTAFPWDKVIKGGFPDGQDFPSAEHLMTAAEQVRASRHRHLPVRMTKATADTDFFQPLTAAERVADELSLRAQALDRGAWEDRMERVMGRVAGVVGKLAAAVDKLPGRGAHK